MNGLYIHTAGKGMTHDKQPDLVLLAKHRDLEIMTQEISDRSAAWLYPPEREDGFEFYYVLCGKIELSDSDGTVVALGEGDSFGISGLKKEVQMRCLEKVKLLCISNTPVFNELEYWRRTWNEQLDKIDEKDHYTRSHSQSVMYIAFRLYEKLQAQCPEFDSKTFAMSALFHDIGKCEVPGALLSKPDRLTDEEYAIVKKHAAASRRILAPIFGEELAVMAGMHHERLDGSGYPEGLKGDQIPFEARILMVADAFDAMTRDRVYQKAVPMAKAARELAAMPEKYDSIVTATLVELVDNGTITLEATSGSNV
ncbi:MAG: HD domain-containing protein [Clostridia bacterium]|nr:HD domain-containing protein [Clostridia bacterium]